MIAGFIVESKLHKFLGFPVEDLYVFDKINRVIAVADGCYTGFFE